MMEQDQNLQENQPAMREQDQNVQDDQPAMREQDQNVQKNQPAMREQDQNVQDDQPAMREQPNEELQPSAENARETEKRPQEDSIKRRKITVNESKIIERRERGESMADLVNTCKRYTSRICSILKNKDMIGDNASKGVIRISSKRLSILDGIVKLRLI
ncbi:hypothetical protein AVEN_157093-1 [Araneus ventricosus]|uniref:Uncharacterized protein n=1 Tax=Araneus ventricosus TaxID=182803 RepID=A0A4Y2FWP5_ARAVE|nr:hypothetical protein AVEN_157093-1 [Araneus ventricosus]